MTYDNILGRLYDTPWLITKESLETLVSIVERRMAGEVLEDEELLAIRGRGSEQQELVLPEKPSIGVLPIQGSIFPKANLLTNMSGATSVNKLKNDFNKMMESDKITSILLDVDSPGGSAEMIKEMADVIYEARSKNIKPIWAIANANAHSAAYYLASQANKFYITPSGSVGSIGVVAVHRDVSARDEQEGVKHTVLSVGKYKADGNPYEALSDSAKEHFLESMGEIYNQFVEDVARGRGTDPETVAEDFGQGRSYKSRTALKKGMVDGIETFDSLINRLKGTSAPAVSNSLSNTGGINMPELTRKTLEVLGLSEDATTEDIENAAVALSTSILPTTEETDSPDFAAMFPEQHAEIMRLRETDRTNKAKLFTSQYERFENGHGLSGTALELVEGLHLKIADGIVTHEDLKGFLDCLASDKAVVDYRELGSVRGEENESASNGLEAGTKLRDLALAKASADGLSYGDALSAVMQENPELARLYTQSVAAERGEN